MVLIYLNKLKIALSFGLKKLHEEIKNKEEFLQSKKTQKTQAIILLNFSSSSNYIVKFHFIVTFI